MNEWDFFLARLIEPAVHVLDFQIAGGQKSTIEDALPALSRYASVQFWCRKVGQSLLALSAFGGWRELLLVYYLA